MLGPSLRMEKKWEYRHHPWGQDPDQAQIKAFLTISRSKTFLEEINPHDDEANKRKGRGMQTYTDDTNAQSEKQIISAMLIILLVHFAPIWKWFNVTKRILFISVFMLLFRWLKLIKMLKTY